MGQHWKEKKRDEMTERDWRIFREDYNIGYKGAMDKCTLPIRNWSEANLPSDLVKVTLPPSTRRSTLEVMHTCLFVIIIHSIIYPLANGYMFNDPRRNCSTTLRYG